MNDSKGVSGLVGLILAALGLWTGAHPTSRFVVLVTQHQAELHTVLTYALTSLGGIVTYVAHPPAWLRAPWDRLKARLLPPTPLAQRGAVIRQVEQSIAERTP